MAGHDLTFSLSPMSPSDHHIPFTTIGSSHQNPSSVVNDEEQLKTPPPKKSIGRPVGSKNKPKPPLIIQQVSEQALKPVIIEVPDGFDVVETVVNFAHSRGVSITVLSVSGFVSSVTLRHPLSNTPAFTIHGPFTLLSFTGTYMIKPPFVGSSSSSSSLNPYPPSSFVVSLSKSSGQSYVGVVGGKVVAANGVMVVATTFDNPEIHRNGVNHSGKERDDKSNDNNNLDDEGCY